MSSGVRRVPWHCTVQLLGRHRSLIFGHIHLLPLAAFDPGADLRRGLAFVRLLVLVDGFPHAHAAAAPMLASEAIEQAGVALAAVAMTVTGLLVKDSPYARRKDVRVLIVRHPATLFLVQKNHGAGMKAFLLCERGS